MTGVASLILVFRQPTRVFEEIQGWLTPYIGSVLLLASFGLLTRQKILGLVTSQLNAFGIGAAELAELNQGAYIGILGTAILLPLITPWLAAFVSKVTALLAGFRASFSELFAIYQWGYYVSTILTVIVKGGLFLFLPVESWSKVTLSLAVLIPTPGVLQASLGALDLSFIIFFLVGVMAIRARLGPQTHFIPWFSMAVFSLFHILMISV